MKMCDLRTRTAELNVLEKISSGKAVSSKIDRLVTCLFGVKLLTLDPSSLPLLLIVVSQHHKSPSA